MAQPRFITFEGGEGAGKSTQIALLADRLRASGETVTVTREPGGTPFAERLRALILDPEIPSHLPISEALLFAAARADHVIQRIVPKLAAGEWVLCDRFVDSTRAYQGVGGGVSVQAVAMLEELAVGTTMPALTFILDLDPTVGLERVRARAADDASLNTPEDDPFERRDPAFHAQLRDAFSAIAAAEPERCRLVDAGQSADTVHDAIWQMVNQRFALEPR